MGLLWRPPRVGILARYRGTYHAHWEAGHGISVWVFPYRQLALGILLGAGVFTAHQFGWVLTASLVSVGFWVILSACERWLPVFPPGMEIAPVLCFSGSWRIDFEGIAGPRRRVWIGRYGPWIRKVQVIRILACTQRSCVCWDARTEGSGPAESK
jgi:hypothetical protein